MPCVCLCYMLYVICRCAMLMCMIRCTFDVCVMCLGGCSMCMFMRMLDARCSCVCCVVLGVCV